MVGQNVIPLSLSLSLSPHFSKMGLDFFRCLLIVVFSCDVFQVPQLSVALVPVLKTFSGAAAKDEVLVCLY